MCGGSPATFHFFFNGEKVIGEIRIHPFVRFYSPGFIRVTEEMR